MWSEKEEGCEMWCGIVWQMKTWWLEAAGTAHYLSPAIMTVQPTVQPEGGGEEGATW